MKKITQWQKNKIEVATKNMIASNEFKRHYQQIIHLYEDELRRVNCLL